MVSASGQDFSKTMADGSKGGLEMSEPDAIYYADKSDGARDHFPRPFLHHSFPPVSHRLARTWRLCPQKSE